MDYSFSRITHESGLPQQWSDRSTLPNLGYHNKILKPINPYSHFFANKPELEVVSDGAILLRQKTHAEIWVKKFGNQVYTLDKCWQRQFYPDTVGSSLAIDKHFNAIFKFYMPWIIDSSVDVKIVSLSDSPFTILTDKVLFDNIDPSVRFPDSPWIKFCIKENQEYMVNDDYGIIPVNTDMYGILISEKQVVDRIKLEYEA